MEIKESELRTKIMGRIKDWYSYPQENVIRVHNIMYPRKTFFERKYPAELEPEKGIMFMIGNMQHDRFEQIIAPIINGKAEKEIEFEGIVGHVDVLGDAVVEIKTTRASRAYPLSEDNIYIDQVKYYCAMTHLNKAIIVIIYYNLTGKDENKKPIKACDIKTYEITFSEDELSAVRKDISKRKELLLKSLVTGDFSILPPCPEWMCKNCPYTEKCTITSEYNNGTKQETISVE